MLQAYLRSMMLYVAQLPQCVVHSDSGQVLFLHCSACS